MSSPKPANVVAALQAEILRMEGFRASNSAAIDAGLGPIKNAFPNASFPLGCIHEFLFSHSEDLATTAGFVSGLLSSLIGSNGAALWISSSRMLFPPALKIFGIEPDRFIFLDLNKEKDVAWAMDEALKCSAITAVIGEIGELSFTASRRLQLAAEQSQATGFILRNDRYRNTTASVSRWKISSLPSEPVDLLPGLGFPKWRVELLRVRNGKPGVWEAQFINGKFVPIYTWPLPHQQPAQQAG